MTCSTGIYYPGLEMKQAFFSGSLLPVRCKIYYSEGPEVYEKATPYQETVCLFSLSTGGVNQTLVTSDLLEKKSAEQPIYIRLQSSFSDNHKITGHRCVLVVLIDYIYIYIYI